MNLSLLNSLFFKNPIFSFFPKMITRSQKRKAVNELVSGEFETSLTEDNLAENLVPSCSKTTRTEPEDLNELKAS